MCDTLPQDARWQTALHEASHAVTALALGGRCERLTIHSDGSGIASLDALSMFDHAVAVAAPVAAMQLFADEPAPSMPAPIAVAADDRGDSTDATPRPDLAVLSACQPRKFAASDASTVAAFCTHTLETQPERWASRYHLVHETARRVVEDHRQQILAVARALFSRGTLDRHDIHLEFHRA
jgi:hypothetical protein